MTFEVLSFSRPAGPLAVACYPVNRLLQLRFGRAAVNAVKKAVEQGSESSLRSRTLA